MAEFPNIEEIAKKAAETALDGFEYQGKTIREWVKIIVEQGWIPVSERLPEDGASVLVTFVDESYGLEILNFYNWCGETVFQGNDTEFEVDELLAWMPLPEPYEEENKCKE